MPHPIWAILAAALVAYGFTAIAKLGAFSLKDNRQTRIWQSGLTGWRQRAYWAHQNSLEGFALFAAAVLAALLMDPTSTAAPIFAWAYIATRIAYGYCYIKDLSRPRSMVWFVGLACIFSLYIIAGVAAG